MHLGWATGKGGNWLGALEFFTFDDSGCLRLCPRLACSVECFATKHFIDD